MYEVSRQADAASCQHAGAQKILMEKHQPSWDEVHAGRFGAGNMPDSQPDYHAGSHAISA